MMLGLARWTNWLMVSPGRVAALLLFGVAAAALGGAAAPHLRAARHHRNALAALERLDFSAARAHLDACLAVWPDAPDILVLAASAARRGRDLNAAEAYLRRRGRIAAPDAELELEHLLLRGQSGNLAALTDLRQRASQAGPQRPRILEVLIQDYINTFQLGRALGALDQLLSDRPGDVQALLGRGKVHELQFDWAAAAHDYGTAVRLDPANRRARLLYAEALLVRGPPAEALVQFEELRRHAGAVPAVVLGLARARRELGRFDEAAADLDELLKVHPDHAAALLERGKLARDQGKPVDALPLLRRAAEKAPHSREAHYTLAQCLLDLRRKDEAEVHLARHREIDADLKRLDRLTREVMRSPGDVQKRYEIGEIFLKHGEPAGAESWLLSAVRFDPQHRDAHAALARAYRQLGNAASADRHARQAEPAKSPGPIP